MLNFLLTAAYEPAALCDMHSLVTMQAVTRPPSGRIRQSAGGSGYQTMACFGL